MSLCPACGAVRGEGRFAVPHCRRGTDSPPLRRAVLWPSRGGGGEGRGGASEERIEKSEEFWCAALRHGFGKGCLGEAGGTNQKKAPSRVPSLIREGSDRLERGRVWGKEKTWSTTRLQAPACGRSGPFRSQTVWYHKKGRRRVWGNRRFLPQMERSGSPRRSGRQKKKAPFGALFFWCGRWDSNPHTEVLASKTRASTIPPLPLISLWPCTFAKQRADKHPYYTIFSLALSIPRPVPTVRGLPVYRRCVRIES